MVNRTTFDFRKSELSRSMKLILDWSDLIGFCSQEPNLGPSFSSAKPIFSINRSAFYQHFTVFPYHHKAKTTYRLILSGNTLFKTSLYLTYTCTLLDTLWSNDQSPLYMYHHVHYLILSGLQSNTLFQPSLLSYMYIIWYYLGLRNDSLFKPSPL